ncbi:YcaO-like family protein [Dongia sp.]|uniref:YcaO-like family protein n=1 Tax=Dongia sp. TaxID=1977262 RepID=UPI0035B0B98A
MFTDSFSTTGIADARNLQRLGITRVGDITGLDTIGLPVWFATRPNSRALSVSQGKGITEAKARLSAVMEAAETAIAERPEDLGLLFGTCQELRARGRYLLPFERIMRCTSGRIDPARERAWVQGQALRSGRAILAPYELIGLDMRTKAPWDHDAFKMSSIGLAAADNAARAALHALLEVVEHDATATLDLFGLGTGNVHGLACETGGDPDLDAALTKVAAAGFTPHFFDLTGTVALPVVACFLTRQVMSSAGAGDKLTAGFACRPDAHQAALAALLECVQSRATDIAGARDDITDADYRASLARLPTAMTSRRRLSEMRGHRAAATFTTIGQMSEHVSDTVLAAGADDIYCFPLSHDVPNLHVARVLVPGLAVAGSTGVTSGGASLIDALMQGL